MYIIYVKIKYMQGNKKMSKRSIKLEFEYVSKPYIEARNGAECREIYVRPIQDHDFWAQIFKQLDEPSLVMKALASTSEESDMSIFAMQIMDSAKARGLSVAFSKTATFHKSDGTTVKVKPAVFTPH